MNGPTPPAPPAPAGGGMKVCHLPEAETPVGTSLPGIIQGAALGSNTTHLIPTTATTMTKPAVLLVLCSAVYLAGCITVGQPPVQRLPMRQVLPPMRTVRLHRSGPVYRNVRVRNGPVKRIYVPMKVGPQPLPPNGYKLGPQMWRPKEIQGFRQPQGVRPHIPYNLNPIGPPRKARHPKPKYPFKPAKHPKKSLAPQHQQQLVQHQQQLVQHQHQQQQQHQHQQLVQQHQQQLLATDSYQPLNTYSGAALVTDSYGAPKPANYKPPATATTTTYGKPHPLLGSPEPPKKPSASNVQFKDEPATSYVNVYQGDSPKNDGTYGFSHSHNQAFEKKFKGKVYSDSESLVSNHRPVYKSKSDTVSQASEDENSQGSFQPPKQTFGFQPYEDAKVETSYGPSQPAQQYYKKQPDNVLGPNYFEQGKSTP